MPRTHYLSDEHVHYIVSALLPEAIFTGGVARTNGAVAAGSRIPATVAG